MQIRIYNVSVQHTAHLSGSMRAQAEPQSGWMAVPGTGWHCNYMLQRSSKSNELDVSTPR